MCSIGTWATVRFALLCDMKPHVLYQFEVCRIINKYEKINIDFLRNCPKTLNATHL